MNRDNAVTHLPTPGETAAEMTGGHKPHASPSVRKFARELGVDLALVQGSGPSGRIAFDDVKRYIKIVMALGEPKQRSNVTSPTSGAS